MSAESPDNPLEFIRSWTRFDPTGTYRYELGREWDPKRGRCTFVMLNPSTADENVLDPTVRKCVGFARRWGFGSLEVLNLFAFRSTDPKALERVLDIIGPDNDRVLSDVKADLVVAAWGNHGALRGRSIRVRYLLREVPLYALGITSTGEPIHPLYVPYDKSPSRYFG